MIYADTSVVLAYMLAEDHDPGERLWQDAVVSSRLLVYETWVRIHARRLTRSHADAVNQVLARISFLELTADVLARALEPFPVVVRTLDAIHLASLEYLRALGQPVALASYDRRQLEAARRLGIPVCDGL